MHARSESASFLLRVFAVFALTASGLKNEALAGTDVVDFSAGALIIPMESYFQTSCGVASAYGLVWRILQSNQPGHYNAGQPVTVYWVVNPSKTSPNRCVPSNLNSPPLPNNPGPTGDANHWDDPDWNDGCDIRIKNLNEQPVVPVTPGVTYPLSERYPDAPLTVFDTTSLTYTHRDSAGSRVYPYARPAFSAVTLDNSSLPPNPRFTNAQYLGGPFVIDAPDAANVINFLQTGDAYVPASALAPFITNTGCGTVPDETNHFVYMHQATIGFTGVVGKRMSRTPPRIAVLESGFVKDISLYRPGVNVLNSYLKEAGLYIVGTSDHTDSGGCPIGTRATCTLNGSDAVNQYPGQIYDQLNAYEDLISTAANPYGILSSVDGSGRPNYAVFWTPHWNKSDHFNYTTNVNGPWPPTYPEYVDNGDGSAGDQVKNSLNNVSHFLERRGTGLMSQCASVATYEGGIDARGTVNIPLTTSKTQFFFTINDLSQYGVSANGPTGTTSGAFEGRNCTDPDYVNGQCMVWSNPGFNFSQIGDFTFVSQEGSVNAFTNRAGSSVYNEGVSRMAITWHDFDPTKYPNSPATSADGNDIFDFRWKDNDKNKGAIVYVAGHEYNESTVGTRIVLNTLFNLGSDPIGPQRGIAAPVSYNDPNGNDTDGSKSVVVAATYFAITGYSSSNEVLTEETPSSWKFPTTPGDVEVHSLIGGAALGQGESNLSDSVFASASNRVPSPPQRNIFTVLGARPVTNPTTLGGGTILHGVGETGMFPVQFSYREINISSSTVPNPNCKDQLHLGCQADGTWGLVAGADGICDLQQTLELTPLDWFADCGVSPAELAQYQNALDADMPLARGLVQIVRGHCYATSTGIDGTGTLIPEPTDAQCNNPEANNIPQLGGFVHSTPAIVPPSPYVPDNGAPRPTVVVAGGWDGMIHCFYLSGGAGYTGAGEVAVTSDNAAPTFVTDWAAAFAANNPPLPMTELWAMVLPSQIPFLRNNTAQADSSVNVIDANIDPDATGVRTHHTLAIVAAGLNGRDLGVIDITNPLKPRVLWYNTSTLAQTGRYPWYAVPTITATDIGGTQYANEWVENNAQGYRLPPLADSGRLPTGLFNFKNVGGLSGTLAAGQWWTGQEPVFAAVVATSISERSSLASKGLVVTATRLDYGQKLWGFVRAYTASYVDNTPPPAPALMSGSSGVERVVVGDMEGRIWTLDARTGANIFTDNGCADPSCQYAAFDTGGTVTAPQPISSMAVAIVPQDATGYLAGYRGELLLIAGTNGVDWPPATDRGQVHFLLTSPRFQVPFRAGGVHLDATPWPMAAAQTYAHQHGVYQEVSSDFPLMLAPGERVYATTVSGSTVFISTARSPQGDPKKLQGAVAGNIYTFDLRSATSATLTMLPATFGNYGNVTVLTRRNGTTSTDFIYANEVSKQFMSKTDNPTTSGPASSTAAYNPVNQGVFSRIISWLERFLRS